MKLPFATEIIKRPFLFGFFVFLMVAGLTQYLTYQRYLIGEDDERETSLRELGSIKDKLQTALAYNLSAAKTLAFIIENYGVPENFDSIARGILNSNKNIDVLQLTRKGVITHVYPLQGNELVVGYDILNAPLTNKEAIKAIEKRELFFAGPFELKQGGIAVVGRLPIFIQNEFFGFSVVITKLTTLLGAIGINTMPTSPFVYQLSKTNPNTQEEEFFLDNTIQMNTSRAVSVSIPEGEWKIYVMPGTNSVLKNVSIFSIIGIVLSVILGVLAWFLAQQPQKLEKLVKERTSQLLAVEGNFKTTLERISDAVVALDNNWRYTFLNQASLPTHPLGLKETLGKVIWDVHPEMKGTIFWDKYHEAMETKKSLAFEEYFPPMEKYFSVKLYPSEAGLTIFYMDITEHKLAEIKFVREKMLSESIINSLPGVFYLYDRQGNFKQWNRNFEMVSGYQAEELKYIKPLDLFDHDEKELLRQKIDQVFEHGTAEVEANFFTKNRKKIPYYFNGHAVQFEGVDYLLGVGIDITERKKSEQAFKESEEKYRYLFNNNPALIMIWDLETYKILEVNEKVNDLYGFTKEEFKDMTILEYRPESDHQKIKAFAERILNTDAPMLRATWQHVKKNGETMFMDIESHRIVYGDRKAILSLGKDITDQVIAERQLKETYDDVRRLNAHLQTIREEERMYIAREIHDELGQQLTGLKMDTYWLSRKIALEEKAQHEKLKQMIELIDGTVKTIRRISSDLRPGILDDLGLIAALEWQSSEFEKRTGIKIHFSSSMTELELDNKKATGVFRIYQETLTNVMRHAQATSLDTVLVQKDEYLFLTIRDNGKGFDTRDTTNKKTLGLMGMKERAIMFGGSLSIESSPGNGTLVSLKMPIAPVDITG